MKNISLNSDKVIGTIPEKLYDIVSEEVLSAYKTLTQKAGLGNDFLGWLSLPDDISEDEINSIYNEVARLRNKAQKIVAIGIGGSYLGAKAVIEALKEENKPACEVIFAGQNLNGAYLHNLLNDLDASDYAIIVISKSGTTTEPAIAFRIIKQHLERKYGAEEAAKRIIAITDANKGTLHDMAKTAGYATFVIPDNVGGRYSVLTPVGLLPIAFAGYDIKELIKGAKDMQALCSDSDNVAVQYAVLRYCLYALNYNVEVFVNYLSHLNYVSEWWKQLYGESEGKDGKGLFPASVSFTTDLHSLGQFIQGGSKILFETVLHVENIKNDVEIPCVEGDPDGLNYIAGKTLHYVNKIAEQATIEAHSDGKVPNMIINIPEINEYYLGQLIYMLEFACGISGYLLDVNPFNQPDVEAYKKNMFRLLGKK